MKDEPKKPVRDQNQVRRIIDVALQVEASGADRVDVVTRFRAALCLAEEAGLTVWVEELKKRIEANGG